MKIEHVEGKKKGKIMVYALSTCVWCNKTKKLLSDLGLDYYYVNVDLVPQEERDKVENAISKWNPAETFPTVVINDSECIVGFQPDELKKEDAMNADKPVVTQEQIDAHYNKLKMEAKEGGYRLNPDADFAKDLAKGLLINTARYGYPSCPCRLASGKKEADLDIICPCDYRDQDITEYNACYCALYVSEKAASGEVEIKSIPERRFSAEKRLIPKADTTVSSFLKSAIPVWRCKVCGYLCARQEPPEICPICKAKKDRFERF